MAEEVKDDEEGCMATTWDYIKKFFLGIFLVIEFIFKMIYNLFWYIGQCLQFIWYPIKEKCSRCCRYCSNKRNPSQDPAFSTFDNEI